MTLHRIRVFEREDGSCWSATSPDLEGFTAVANTREELKKLVNEGVAFYLESGNFVINFQQIEAGGSLLRSTTLPSRLSSTHALHFSWGSNNSGLHVSSTIGAV